MIYHVDATTTENAGIDVTPKIQGLSSKLTPLDTLVNLLPQEGANGPKFEWEGAAEQTVYVTLGENIDNSATEFTVSSTTGVFDGDILEGFGSTNGEQIRVSSVDDSTTLTVVRGVNNVTKDTFSTSDKLYIVGTVTAEGSYPDEYSYTPNEYYNYTTPLACEINWTFTANATKYRTDRQAFHDREVMLAYKRARERMYLYLDRYENTTTHFRYMGGIKYWTDYAESNKVDANMSHTHSSTKAALTLALWNNYLEDATTYGTSELKYFLCGTAMARCVMDLYESKISITYTDQLGFDMPVIHTIYGNIGILMDPCMKGTYNEPRYWGFSIDPEYIRRRNLIPHSKRDINYGSNLKTGYQIHSENGLAFYNPFTLVQYNISAAS